jgi:hypothetical protein
MRAMLRPADLDSQWGNKSATIGAGLPGGDPGKPAPVLLPNNFYGE